MIRKGAPLYAVIREDAATDYAEVLACGAGAAWAEARMEDFAATSSGKRRRLLYVRLTVEEILEERVEKPVSA